MIDATYAYSLDAKDELGHLRDRFIVNDSELIYLDGNSLGRLPRATERRLQELITREWGQKLIRSWGEGWFELQEKVGNKIAQIIGARPGEVIVADSTSVNLYKLALAAMMARPQRKHILSDDLNFPSDYYIFQGITQLLPGTKLRRLNAPDGIHGVPLEAWATAMNEDSNLLSLSHTAFKSGFTYDMAAVTAVARENGVMTLWDLSHSVGSVPINLQEAKVDLAVGCTYKYLNGGPGAPAFLYVRQSLQETLGNPIAGWFGQKNMFALDPDYTPEPNIRRFLTGTPPVLSLAAVEMGVDTILEAEMRRIRAKSVAQTEFFIELFYQILEPLGFTLNSPRDVAQRGSHVSIGHPEGWRINQALIEEKHVLPDFREPDNLRFGFAPLYTSYSDIYTAVMRLRAVLNEKLYEKYSVERTTVT